MRDSRNRSGKVAASFDADKDLRGLFSEAHSHYRTEVIDGGKGYDRFVDDFIFGHQFYCAETVDEGNARGVNIRRIGSLLRDRRDLVEKYFSGTTFGSDDFAAMFKDFNRGTAYIQASCVKTLNFGGALSAEQTTTIASIANSLHIFRQEVSAEDMADLFSPSPQIRLVSANNRRLAVLFDALSCERLIGSDWQKVIAASGIIVSSTNAPLTQSKLSSALNGARADGTAAFPTIRKRVHEVAEMR